MEIAQITAFCEALPAVTADHPFGSQPRCYRVGGKIFAEVFPDGVRGALRVLLEDESIDPEHRPPMLVLRCEPAQGDFWRTQYPKAVLRPYHTPPAQHPYANTILLDGAVPDEVLRDMLRHAYTHVRDKLPRSARDRLGER